MSTQNLVIPKKNKIARKLVIWIVLFSSFVTLIMTADQLYRDYSYDVSIVKSRMNQLKAVNLKTLAENVWVMDKKGIATQLEGIMNLPSVQYIELNDGIKLNVALGEIVGNNVITKQFPLLYDYKGKKREIANLRVVANLDDITNRIFDKALFILISNAIKTFLVAGFMLILFQQLVTRHLAVIAHFMDTQDVNDLDSMLVLDRKSRGSSVADELGIVENAINRMQVNLKNSITMIKSREKQFRDTFNQAAVGIAHIDIDGGFLRVNQKLFSILEIPANKFMSLHLNELVQEEYRTIDDTSRQQLLNGDIEHYSVEKKICINDKQFSWVNMTYSLSFNELNDPEYFIVVIEDIEKRKNIELELEEYRNSLEEKVVERTHELEVLNKELESFSYSVSHDLRAPLRPIAGFSQALLEDYSDVIDDAGKDYLARIRDGATKMGELIDSLLMLSRVTRTSIQEVAVDLTVLSEEIVAQCAQDEPKRNVKVDIESGLALTGDLSLITIMMTNLISNAWKYTGNEEFAEIHIGSKLEGNQKTYYVRDNGVGFDMQYVDKLFSAFQRLHSPDDFDGIGIGLATVARVINRHGGEIWVDAKKDKGATFFFTL